MPRKQRNHEIIERYCSHVDDNVIMIRKRGDSDKYVCLSSQRCRHIHPNGCERAEAEQSQTDAKKHR